MKAYERGNLSIYGMRKSTVFAVMVCKMVRSWTSGRNVCSTSSRDQLLETRGNQSRINGVDALNGCVTMKRVAVFNV